MKDLFVVIDTNVIYQHRKVGDSNWSRFAMYVNKWRIKVVIPKIVQYETLDRLKTDYSEVQNRARDLIKDAQQLPLFLGSVSNDTASLRNSDMVAMSMEEELGAVCKYLTELIPCPLEFAEWPTASYGNLVDRMFSRRRPFKKNSKNKDAGWRDTLVWYTALDLLKTDGDFDVLLITANTEDFAEPSKNKSDTSELLKLHDDFVIDIPDSKHEVHLCRSLSQFESHYAIMHMSSWQNYWESDFKETPAQIGLRLYEDHWLELVEAASAAIPKLFKVPSHFETEEIEVGEPGDVQLIDLYKIEEGKILVRAYLFCEVEYSFETYEFDELEDPDDEDDLPDVEFDNVDVEWTNQRELLVENSDILCIQISTVFEPSTEDWQQLIVDSVSRLLRGTLLLKNDISSRKVNVGFIPEYGRFIYESELSLESTKELLNHLGKKDLEIPESQRIRLPVEIPTAVAEKWKLMSKRSVRKVLSQ